MSENENDFKLRLTYIGKYIRRKYKQRAEEVGVYTVAKQLRKQGYSLEVALLILL
jgi:hypothetical protein